MNPAPSRVQVILRMARGRRRQLRALAKAHGMSVNAFIVAILFDPDFAARFYVHTIEVKARPDSFIPLTNPVDESKDD